MRTLFVVSMCSWIIFLIVKRELHLEDRPDRGTVRQYNVMLTISLAILIFYFVVMAA